MHGQVVKPNTLLTSSATFFCLEMWEIRFWGRGAEIYSWLYLALCRNCAKMTSSRYASSLTVQEVHGRSHLHFFSFSASSQSLLYCMHLYNLKRFLETSRYSFTLRPSTSAVVAQFAWKNTSESIFRATAIYAAAYPSARGKLPRKLPNKVATSR